MFTLPHQQVVTYAKIGEFDNSGVTIQEDVRRLDITVHETIRVEVFKTLSYLLDNAKCLRTYVLV